MTNYNVLKSKIVLKFGTSKAFAEAMERPEHYVSRLMTGKQAFTQEDIRLWAEILELTDPEIIEIFFD